MIDGRWAFRFIDCNCPDARFIYGLSRKAGPWAALPYGDARSQAPVECHKDDAAQWKEMFAEIKARPLVAFALAIDFNQEPAQRALEANRWKLVATGERGHDREIAGKHVYSRLYMKKFPKSGHVFPTTAPSNLTSSWSCSMDVFDYGTRPNEVPTTGSSYTSGCLVLNRIPLDKLATMKLPETNFECIAKTNYAHYFLSNAVELYVRAK